MLKELVQLELMSTRMCRIDMNGIQHFYCSLCVGVKLTLL